MSDRTILALNLGTLADLVDGRAGRQFDRAIADMIAAVTGDEAQRDGVGYAKGQVLVTVTVEGTAEEDGGNVSIAVAVESKAPKNRASGSALTCLGAGEYGIDITPPPQTRLPFAVDGKE